MQRCNCCLLDSSVTPVFSLDDDGICNYCNYYSASVKDLGSLEQRKLWVKNKVNEIKEKGKNNKYDCVVGISGGVDSSYLAYWAKVNDLRPLVVHFDNGWNSELAAQNVKNICEKLGFELQTYVVNWEEFRELQLAYIRAGVIDIEVLTDHAIIATIYQIAERYNIRYTLSGFNFATEAVMPKGWVFDKGDWENIKDIYSKFGRGKSINSFPHLSFYKKLYNSWFGKLEAIKVLNYLPYNKSEAKKIITEKLAWQDYGGKHYESLFTKFYQAYILPTKFKVDKRRAHLSNLICSGQITKVEALKELQKPLYSESDLKQEKEYILKKLGLSELEFDKLMQEPARPHDEFKTEKHLWNRYFKFVSALKFQFK